VFDSIKAILEKDPAAKPWEVILYPCLYSLFFHRIAHFLYTLHLPFFPRLISQVARFLTGIEIHPGATIGKGFFIDHGMGVVIGETSLLGDYCTLFQGVTLGGTGKGHGKRHPTLGDHVMVGVGAKVLGNITIGDHSYIGANAVVLNSVPAHSTVVGIPGRVVKVRAGDDPEATLEHAHLPDPLYERVARLQKELHLLEKSLIKNKKKSREK
jgi:serine O-acetyltransferase